MVVKPEEKFFMKSLSKKDTKGNTLGGKVGKGRQTTPKITNKKKRESQEREGFKTRAMES